MDLDKKMRGKVLDGRARKIIINVDNYFTKEREDTKELLQLVTRALKEAPNNQEAFISKQLVTDMIELLLKNSKIMDRVESATGVSRKTVKRLKLEKRNASLTGEIEKPIRRKRSKEEFFDEHALSVLRNILDSCEHETPTVHDLLTFAQEELDYKGSLTSLRRIIKNRIGYEL